MSDQTKPVLYDRNGEPIHVGDRFVWDEPGFEEVSGLVADSSGIHWDGDDSGYIDRHPLRFKPDMYQHYTKLKEDKVQEPLVRMGRTDLYRRGDTEIKDGRRVAKPGAEPVTVLTTTLDGVFCCAYQHRGTSRCVRPNGRGLIDDYDHDHDLAAIDPAPKIVPWEFSEIPVDHWFRKKGDFAAWRVDAVSLSLEHCLIGGVWTWPDKLLADYAHSASHAGPFEPCGKYS